MSKVLGKEKIKPMTIEDVINIVNNYPNGKSPGPTGISPKHLKCLINFKRFAENYRDVINSILEKPELMKKIPLLYRYIQQFKPKSIEKKDEYRPIAMGEAMLMVMHKYINRQLKHSIKLHANQYCLRNNPVLRAKLELCT
jgi:hypothetical protein